MKRFDALSRQVRGPRLNYEDLEDARNVTELNYIKGKDLRQEGSGSPSIFSENFSTVWKDSFKKGEPADDV